MGRPFCASPADVRCHGVGDGIVQYIAVHGAVLFAGDALRVRPCGVQRLQALQPGQRGGLRFGAVQRFRLLHIPIEIKALALQKCDN